MTKITDEEVDLYFKNALLAQPTHFDEEEPFFSEIKDLFYGIHYHVFSSEILPYKTLRRLTYHFVHRFASYSHSDSHPLYSNSPLLIRSKNYSSEIKTFLWANGGFTISPKFLTLFVDSRLIESLIDGQEAPEKPQENLPAE